MHTHMHTLNAHAFIVKTLKGEAFEVEVQEDASVLDLKRQLAILKGYPASEDALTAPKTAMKIIHLGKILSDNVIHQNSRN
jgi:hypothetical protein